MKKYLLFLAIVFLLPHSAFGAFNDVSLTTDATISVGGENFTVFGATSTLESIVVDAASFTVGMATGSSLVLYSGVSRTFTVSPVVTQITATPYCEGSYSTLTLTGVGSATVTVTPSGYCVYGGGSSYGDSGSSSSPPPAPPPESSPPVATTTSPTATSSPTTATTTVVVLRGPFLTKTLQLGSTDPEVILLQQFLVGWLLLAVPSTIPLGYFGSLTVDAVMKFQGMAGLEKVGIVGPKTRDAIYATTTATVYTSSIPVSFLFTRPLRIGSSGQDVAALQQILIAKGFLVFNARSKPGYFGGLSKIAVALFQKSLGLEPVGVVGPMTRKALNKITGAF